MSFHTAHHIQAQLNSLPPLSIPRRLIQRRKEGEEEEEGEGGEGESANQTDQEKTVVKKTAALVEVSDGTIPLTYKGLRLCKYKLSASLLCS